MPVILSPDEYRTWLERTTTDPTGLKKMFQPYPADLMEMWQVSPEVNKVGNDSADLVAPVENAANTFSLNANPAWKSNEENSDSSLTPSPPVSASVLFESGNRSHRHATILQKTKHKIRFNQSRFRVATEPPPELLLSMSIIHGGRG